MTNLTTAIAAYVQNNISISEVVKISGKNERDVQFILEDLTDTLKGYSEVNEDNLGALIAFAEASILSISSLD